MNIFTKFKSFLASLCIFSLCLSSMCISTVAFAVDTTAPTLQIASTTVEALNESNARITFKIVANDNVGINTLQYRARIDGGPFSAWTDYPYVENYPITFGVSCTFFRFEVRAVDTSGNLSLEAAREFRAPFTNDGGSDTIKTEKKVKIPRCTGKTPEACEDLLRQKIGNVKITIKGKGVNDIDGPYQDSAQPGKVFKTSPGVKESRTVSFSKPLKVTIYYWNAAKKLKKKPNCPAPTEIVAESQGNVRFESLIQGKSFRQSELAPGDANKALDRYNCAYRVTFENSFRGAGDAIVASTSTISENDQRIYILKVRLNLASEYEMAFSPGVPPSDRLTFGPDNQTPHQNFMVLTKSSTQKNFFKVAVTEGNTGRFEVNPGAQANGLTLYLYDAGGNLISTQPTDQNGDATFDVLLPTAGNYSLFAVKKGKGGSDREGFKNLLVIDRANQSFTTLDGRFLESFNGTYQEGFTAQDDEAIAEIANLIVEIVNDSALIDKVTGSDRYSLTDQQKVSFLLLREAILSDPGSARDIVKTAIQAGFYPTFVTREGKEILGRRDLLKLPTILKGLIADFKKGGALSSTIGNTANSGEGALWLSAPGLQLSTNGAVLSTNGGNTVTPLQEQLKPGQQIGLIGLDGGSLIGLDGGSLVGPDGGTLIGLDGGSLIGLDGGSLVGTRPLGLIGLDGGS